MLGTKQFNCTVNTDKNLKEIDNLNIIFKYIYQIMVVKTTTQNMKGLIRIWKEPTQQIRVLPVIWIIMEIYTLL